MSKSKFRETLRKDLAMRRTGLLGLGRKLEVSNGDLKYRVHVTRANEEMAQYLNSKIPVATIRPKI